MKTDLSPCRSGDVFENVLQNVVIPLQNNSKKIWPLFSVGASLWAAGSAAGSAEARASETPTPREGGTSNYISAIPLAGEIQLLGKVSSTGKGLIIKAERFALPNGKSQAISPAKEKEVVIKGDTVFAINQTLERSFDYAKLPDGAEVSVTGKDLGAGQPLVARLIQATFKVVPPAIQPTPVQPGAVQPVAPDSTQSSTLRPQLEVPQPVVGAAPATVAPTLPVTKIPPEQKLVALADLVKPFPYAELRKDPRRVYIHRTVKMRFDIGRQGRGAHHQSLIDTPFLEGVLFLPENQRDPLSVKLP